MARFFRSGAGAPRTSGRSPPDRFPPGTRHHPGPGKGRWASAPNGVPRGAGGGNGSGGNGSGSNGRQTANGRSHGEGPPFSQGAPANGNGGNGGHGGHGGNGGNGHRPPRNGNGNGNGGPRDYDPRRQYDPEYEHALIEDERTEVHDRLSAFTQPYVLTMIRLIWLGAGTVLWVSVWGLFIAFLHAAGIMAWLAGWLGFPRA